MRGLLIAVALILLLIVVGWITVSYNNDRASMTLEKEKIKQDAQQLEESAREFANKADERFRGAVKSEAEPEPETQP